MSILIKNGRVITADSDQVADVYLEGEKIVAIGSQIADALDADVLGVLDQVGRDGIAQVVVGLPAIEFALRAAIQCKGEAVSLTLSIADTFKTLGKEELRDKRAATATLAVPARQMTLAASSRFCVDGDSESADELLVPGFATAYASLRCAREEHVSAHFGSTPLQLRLSCARTPEEPQEPGESSTDR